MADRRTAHRRVSSAAPSSPPRISSRPSKRQRGPSFSHQSTFTNRPGTSSPRSPRQPQQAHALPAPPWPFNEQDTALIRAGYQPQWTPTLPDPEPKPKPKPKPAAPEKGKPSMAEPRARMARHKGQMNFQNERTFYSIPDQPVQANLLSPPLAARLRRPKSPPQLLQ
jgi:transcription initiation factor TFIID subunit 13